VRRERRAVYRNAEIGVTTLLNVLLLGVLIVLILDREEGRPRRAAASTESQPRTPARRRGPLRLEARLRARLHAVRTPRWARERVVSRRPAAAGASAAGLTLLGRDDA